MWNWIQMILEAGMIVALVIAVRLLKRLEKSLDEPEDTEGTSTGGCNIEQGKESLECGKLRLVQGSAAEGPERTAEGGMREKRR